MLANNANLLHCGFCLSVAFLFCILQVTTNLQSSVLTCDASLLSLEWVHREFIIADSLEDLSDGEPVALNYAIALLRNM